MPIRSAGECIGRHNADLNVTDETTEFYTSRRHRSQRAACATSRASERAGVRLVLPARTRKRPSATTSSRSGRSAAPEAVMAALRNEVARLDPQLPLYDMRTMLERVDASLATRKVALALAAMFGDRGVVACGARHLRCAGVSRRAAAPRDRHPHRPRQLAARRIQARAR